jgi:hypothetical protein
LANYLPDGIASGMLSLAQPKSTDLRDRLEDSVFMQPATLGREVVPVFDEYNGGGGGSRA